MRHSGANRVEVEIEKRRSRVRLTILDNGYGVPAPSGNGATRAGMGLSGLGERLELMGGSYSIESQPGATKLIAEIPEPA
jgi:two-component system NarL family sensor kinase